MRERGCDPLTHKETVSGAIESSILSSIGSGLYRIVIVSLVSPRFGKVSVLPTVMDSDREKSSITNHCSFSSHF